MEERPSRSNAFEARRAGPLDVSPARQGWDTNTKHVRAPEARHRLAYAPHPAYPGTPFRESSSEITATTTAAPLTQKCNLFESAAAPTEYTSTHARKNFALFTESACADCVGSNLMPLFARLRRRTDRPGSRAKGEKFHQRAQTPAHLKVAGASIRRIPMNGPGVRCRRVACTL
jgi:hypothetical protein